MDKPIKFDKTAGSLEDFKGQHNPSKIIDRFDLLLEELFLIRNPHTKFVKEYQSELADFTKSYLAGKQTKEVGEWFLFPWSTTLVHYLPDSEHQEVRTARNKNIITDEEQARFYNFRVAIAGLSVGSHPALTLAMMGGCRSMKLADPDVLGPANLNRLRYDFTKIGEPKVDIVTQTLWQVNPYGDYVAFPDGVTDQNISSFLDNIDVLIEEVDNLEMKIKLRLAARERGIPVIMATDNGDGVIVDIERYDLDKNLDLFNGVAGNLTLDEFKHMQPTDLPKLATKIAGKDVVAIRMLGSITEVGKTLYSWPQLGDAATLAGVAIAYVVKRLALGEPLKVGKLEVNLDAIFDPDYSSAEAIKARDNYRANFAKNIGL